MRMSDLVRKIESSRVSLEECMEEAINQDGVNRRSTGVTRGTTGVRKRYLNRRYKCRQWCVRYYSGFEEKSVSGADRHMEQLELLKSQWRPTMVEMPEQNCRSVDGLATRFWYKW